MPSESVSRSDGLAIKPEVAYPVPFAACPALPKLAAEDASAEEFAPKLEREGVGLAAFPSGNWLPLVD